MAPAVAIFFLAVFSIIPFSFWNAHEKRAEEKLVTEKIDNLLADEKSSILFNIPLFCLEGKTYARMDGRKWSPVMVGRSETGQSFLPCGNRK